MLEGVIKRQIKDYLSILRMRGDLAFYEIYTGPRIFGKGNHKVFLKNPSPGIPDLVILPNQKPTIWAELKSDKGRQRPEQKAFQESCDRMGHTYCLWRSLDDCKNYLDGLGIRL